MIETILAVGGVIAAGKGIYDAYQTTSAILKGGTRGERIADQTLLELKGMNQRIERLSDSILYAPDLEMVRNVNTRQKERQFRNIREQLDPIQQQLGSEILSSSIIATPDKMQQALGKNPWDVLINISPVKYAKEPNERGFLPISFHHGQEWYIGWQKKGALPSLFDCEYQDLEQLFSQGKGRQNNQEIEQYSILEHNAILEKEIMSDLMQVMKENCFSDEQIEQVLQAGRDAK